MILIIPSAKTILITSHEWSIHVRLSKRLIIGVNEKRKTYSHKRTFFFTWIDVFFIHSYPSSVLKFSFVTELAENPHKNLHILNLGIF